MDSGTKNHHHRLASNPVSPNHRPKVSLYAAKEKSTARPSLPLSEYRCLSLDNSTGKTSRLGFIEDPPAVSQRGPKKHSLILVKDVAKNQGKHKKSSASKLLAQDCPLKKTLKNVSSCTYLNPDLTLFEKSKIEPQGTVDLRNIRDAKVFRKIFTPQGEFDTAATVQSKASRKSGQRRAVMARDIMKKLGEGGLRKIGENCSASTASGGGSKEVDSKKIGGDSTAAASELKAQLQKLKGKFKGILNRYKKREELLLKENERLREENQQMKKRMKNFLHI